VADMPEASPKRIFSYDEAVSLLPEVRRITELAHQRVEALSAAGPRKSADAQRQVDEVVDQWAQALAEHGIEVKGLWLVDFDNGSGYYCWRYPEDGLQYYHSYDEGFRGRIRIH
jgi:hypothetical protein